MVPSVSASQVYKYLGVDILPRRTKAMVEELLREGLESISSAPLRPHQRLYIATYHLLPKMQHKLALAPALAKYLGGLGVPLQEHVVPLMKAKRLGHLDASSDPVIAAMLRSALASAGLARQTRRKSLNGREITSHNLKATLAEMLHHSVDGRGLANALQVPECNRWVNPMFGGVDHNITSSYVSAIKVRGNLIGTALRRSRSRPQASTRCDCCGRAESLGHILQVCPGTHASRVVGMIRSPIWLVMR